MSELKKRFICIFLTSFFFLGGCELDQVVDERKAQSTSRKNIKNKSTVNSKLSDKKMMLLMIHSLRNIDEQK